ncbi:MAG: polyprenol monophosphomannose synthase [Vicinamibacterales bacterium]
MKTLVLVPTYNERENIPILVREILAFPGTEVMVLDDQSPDGTGQVAEALATEFPGRVHVVHRTGPRGLGRSYLEGFRRALQTDVDFVCQMDADLSHDPKYLPNLVALAQAGADMVIGSRYLSGISVVNWPLRRIILSTYANKYIRSVTGAAVTDITAGYRCWRRTALAKLPLDRIISEGYSFIVEVTFHAAHAGLRIEESPIIFVERRQGASKLSPRVLVESLITPWRLVLGHGRIRSHANQDGGYNPSNPKR